MGRSWAGAASFVKNSVVAGEAGGTGCWPGAGAGADTGAVASARLGAVATGAAGSSGRGIASEGVLTGCSNGSMVRVERSCPIICWKAFSMVRWPCWRASSMVSTRARGLSGVAASAGGVAAVGETGSVCAPGWAGNACSALKSGGGDTAAPALGRGDSGGGPLKNDGVAGTGSGLSGRGSVPIGLGDDARLGSASGVGAGARGRDSDDLGTVGAAGRAGAGPKGSGGGVVPKGRGSCNEEDSAEGHTAAKMGEASLMDTGGAGAGGGEMKGDSSKAELGRAGKGAEAGGSGGAWFRKGWAFITGVWGSAGCEG